MEFPHPRPNPGHVPNENFLVIILKIETKSHLISDLQCLWIVYGDCKSAYREDPFVPVLNLSEMKSGGKLKKKY